MQELRDSGWYDKTAQAFAVFQPVKSVGVVGDTPLCMGDCASCS